MPIFSADARTDQAAVKEGIWLLLRKTTASRDQASRPGRLHLAPRHTEFPVCPIPLRPRK